MDMEERTKEALLLEIGDLRERLAEAQATLRAIRNGEVDALVISGPAGDQVYILKGADLVYRTLVETMNEGAVTLSHDGIILCSNSQFAGMLGLPLEKLMGSQMQAHVNPADLHTFETLLMQGVNKCARGEAHLRSKDGALIPVDLSLSSLPIQNLPGVCMVVTDLTERKRSEAALQEKEARYRAVVEDQTELVCRFLPDYSIIFINDAYCRYFGETPERLVGRNFWHLVPKKGRQKLKRHFESLSLDNPVLVIEHPFSMPDGEIRWQQWTDRAIFDDRGRIKEIQSVGRDITKQKHAEEALRRSEKQLRFLSSQLLKVQETERKHIARELHDSVGQYLSAIKFGMETALQFTGRGKAMAMTKSLETLVPMIRQAIEDVRRIYMDLRPSLLDDLGITATIAWFCREFQQIYSNINIEKRIEIDEEDVPERLKIVFFRVVQEALNNVSKHSEANLVRISLTKNSNTLDLCIEDNGRGFDLNEALSRKNSKEGLGLASMKERTELSGGLFTVRSAGGKGVTIRASWPLCSLSD